MPTIWDPATREQLLQRAQTITPSCKGRWGKFTAPQMLAHLTDGVRMATGDLFVPGRKLPLRYPPLKQLILYWLPFPKGTPTAPELLARTATDWDGEQAALRHMFDVFSARPRNGAWPTHPAFGPLTGTQWGILVYRHMDHHLRQFSV